MKTIISSLSLFACSALVIGCAASEGELEPQLVDELGSSFQAQSTVRLVGGAQGEPQLVGEGWTQASPGVWQKGEHRLVMGLEGHRAALSLEEKNLAQLQLVGAEASLVQASEQELARLRDTVASLKESGPTTQATCNIAFYEGPSSPITGASGVAALAQMVCSDGTQSFTVQSQACVNGACTPIVVQSNAAVGATPWTAGVIVNATAGLPCSGVNVVTPPGVGSSWSGPCG